MRYLFGLALLLTLTAGARSGENADIDQDRKLIQGSWRVTAYDQDGTRLSADTIKKMKVVIKADRLTITPRVVVQKKITPGSDRKQAEVKFTVAEDKADEAKWRLTRTGKKKVIELTQDAGRGLARKIKGLYAVEKNSLTICLPLSDRLPKKIPGSPKAGVVRLILERMDLQPNPEPEGK